MERTQEEITAAEEARLAKALNKSSRKATGGGLGARLGGSPMASPLLARPKAQPAPAAAAAAPRPAGSEPKWKQIQREKEAAAAARAAAEAEAKKEKFAAIARGETAEEESSAIVTGVAALAEESDADAEAEALAAEERRLARRIGAMPAAPPSTRPAEPKSPASTPVIPRPTPASPAVAKHTSAPSNAATPASPAIVKEDAADLVGSFAANLIKRKASDASSQTGSDRWSALEAKTASASASIPVPSTQASAPVKEPALVEATPVAAAPTPANGTTDATPAAYVSGVNDALGSLTTHIDAVESAVKSAKAPEVKTASVPLLTAAGALTDAVLEVGPAAKGALVAAKLAAFRSTCDSIEPAVEAFAEEPEDEDVVELIESRLSALRVDAEKVVAGIKKAALKLFSTGGSAAGAGATAVSASASTAPSSGPAVSQLQESSDGSSYELVHTTSTATSDNMKLEAVGRKLRFTEVEEIEKDATTVERVSHVRNWQLPFDFDAKLVQAGFDAGTCTLGVHIPKGAEVANGAVDADTFGSVCNFTTEANPDAATETIDMEFTQDAKAVYVILAAAKSAEEVTVTISTDSLEVEAVRTVVEERPDGSSVTVRKTVTDSLQLPFAIERDSIQDELIDADKPGAGHRITLPKPSATADDSANVESVEVPIAAALPGRA